MTKEGHSSVTIGAMEINFLENTLIYESVVKVSPKCMRVLQLLLTANNQVVSRDQFLNEVWHERFGADESLSKAISELRRAFKSLNDGAEKAIITIPKSGYRLDSPLLEMAVPVVRGPKAEAFTSAKDNGLAESNATNNKSVTTQKKYKLLAAAITTLVAIFTTVFVYFSQLSPAQQVIEKPSLLVLPMPYMFTESTGQMQLDEGDIIDLLSQSNHFDVEPITSTDYFREKSITAKEITQVLDVDFVLQWRIAQIERANYLNLLLYRTADERIVWRGVIKASLDDLVATVSQKLLELNTLTPKNVLPTVSQSILRPDNLLLINNVDKLIDKAEAESTVLPLNQAISLLDAMDDKSRQLPQVQLKYAEVHLAMLREGVVNDKTLSDYSTYLARAEDLGAPAHTVAFTKAQFYTPSPKTPARFANKELAAYYFEQASLAGLNSIKFYSAYSYFLIAQEQYGLASILLENGLKQHPLSFSLLMNYFAVNYRLGNPQVLDDILAKSRRLFPNYPMTEHASMLVHMMKGAPELALEDVKNAPKDSNLQTALLIYAQFDRELYHDFLVHLEALASHALSSRLQESFRFALALHGEDDKAIFEMLSEQDEYTLQSIYGYERFVMQAVITLPRDKLTAHALALGQSSAKRQMNSRSFLEVRGLAALFDAAYQDIYLPADDNHKTLKNVITELESLKGKEHGHYHTLAEMYAYLGEYNKTIEYLHIIADKQILPSLGRYYSFTQSPFFKLNDNTTLTLIQSHDVETLLTRIQSMHLEKGKRLSLWLPESLTK